MLEPAHGLSAQAHRCRKLLFANQGVDGTAGESCALLHLAASQNAEGRRIFSLDDFGGAHFGGARLGLLWK